MPDVAAPPPIDPLDHLGLVGSVAKGFRGRGADYDDLRSEGFLGLLEAIRRFNPGRGCEFSTFAVPWIKLKIRDYLCYRAPLVRAPSWVVRRMAAARKDGLADPGLRSLRRSCLEAGLRATAPRGSLDEADLGAELADARAPDPSAGPEHDDDRAFLRFILGMLDDRESAVIRGRFGIGRDGPLILREIGDALGLTRERVRQIEARALERLRALVA